MIIKNRQLERELEIVNEKWAASRAFVIYVKSLLGPVKYHNLLVNFRQATAKYTREREMTEEEQDGP